MLKKLFCTILLAMYFPFSIEALAPSHMFEERRSESPHVVTFLQAYMAWNTETMFTTNPFENLNVGAMRVSEKNDLKQGLKFVLNFSALKSIYSKHTQEFINKLKNSPVEQYRETVFQKQIYNFIYISLVLGNDIYGHCTILELYEKVRDRSELWEEGQWQIAYEKGLKVYEELYLEEIAQLTKNTSTVQENPNNDPDLNGKHMYLDEAQYKLVDSKPRGAMPGAIYEETETKQRWLIKWGGDVKRTGSLLGEYRYERVLQEVMSAQLLHKMDINMPEMKVVRGARGHAYVASKYIKDLHSFESIYKQGVGERAKINKKKLQRMYAYSLLTANPDFFNPYNDNIMFQKLADGSYDPILIEAGEAFSKTQNRLKRQSSEIHKSWLNFLKWSTYYDGHMHGMKQWMMEDFTEEMLGGILAEMKIKVKKILDDDFVEGGGAISIKAPLNKPSQDDLNLKADLDLDKIVNRKDYFMNDEESGRSSQVLMKQEGDAFILEFKDEAESKAYFAWYTSFVKKKHRVFTQDGNKWIMEKSVERKNTGVDMTRNPGFYQTQDRGLQLVFSGSGEKLFMYDLLGLESMEREGLVERGQGLHEMTDVFLKFPDQEPLSRTLPQLEAITPDRFKEYDQQVQKRVRRHMKHQLELMQYEIQIQEDRRMAKEVLLWLGNDAMKILVTEDSFKALVESINTYEGVAVMKVSGVAEEVLLEAVSDMSLFFENLGKDGNAHYIAIQSSSGDDLSAEQIQLIKAA